MLPLRIIGFNFVCILPLVTTFPPLIEKRLSFSLLTFVVNGERVEFIFHCSNGWKGGSMAFRLKFMRFNAEPSNENVFNHSDRLRFIPS